VIEVKKYERIIITVRKNITKGYSPGTSYCSRCRLTFKANKPIFLIRCPYCNSYLRHKPRKPKKNRPAGINPLLYLDDLDLQ
jgi:DNA-directed RNA polymerase subunit RPC12/RpoP